MRNKIKIFERGGILEYVLHCHNYHPPMFSRQHFSLNFDYYKYFR